MYLDQLVRLEIKGRQIDGVVLASLRLEDQICNRQKGKVEKIHETETKQHRRNDTKTERINKKKKRPTGGTR